MRRPIVAVLTVAMLALAPIDQSSAQARLSVSGGIAAPMSDLSDAADVGYSIAAGLNFGGGGLPIGARLEGSLTSFGLQSFPEDVRILNATANGVIDLGQQAGSPYLIGGLGLYNSKFGSAGSENAVGVNLGGGLRFPVGTLSTFFEARYHAVLDEAGTRGTLHYIPIVFGVLF